MNLVSRTFYRTFFLTAIAATVFVLGCSKKPKAPPPPPPPPPAAASPTVTLQASPLTINKGDSTTLSWSSTNATQLSISPEVGAVSPEGSTKVTPSASTTYAINATGPGGSADASVRVTLNAPPPPPPPPPAGLSDAELFARDVKDAFFDYNKSDIRPDARDALGKTADFLRNHAGIKVTIEGHCDERGSTEYNLGLGDRRASATKQFLVSLGISADRMNTVSYGKEKPFCMEHDETCWQQNRRGHFIMAK
jgi:peptidoglycan-associated lipoprotein